MVWIECHQELETHPKLFRLSAAIKAKPHETIGHLICLWWWCLKYAENGVLDKFGPSEIAMAAHYDGDPETFVKGLIESGFFDETPLKVHDWVRYAGQWLRRKYHNSNDRWLKETWRIYGLKYGDKKPSSNPHGTPTKPTLTKPNLTIPNHTLPNLNKDIVRTKFKKPTASDVSEYATSIGFALNGQHFVDYYESKGWVVGRSPMKDWKACVRTWKRNNFGGGYGSKGTDGIGNKGIERNDIENGKSKFAGIETEIQL